MGRYDGIILPVSGQPISVSQFGAPVKAAINDLDTRILIQNFVRKTANQSSGASNATLFSDNHLFFPVEASSIYRIDGMLVMAAGSATPDVKFAWQMPTLATATGGIGTAAQDHAASDAQPMVGQTTGAVPLPHAVNVVIVTGTNAGTVTLRWAQNVSDVSPSVLIADSFIAWSKVG
jgi:hypothetical protein